MGGHNVYESSLQVQSLGVCRLSGRPWDTPPPSHRHDHDQWSEPFRAVPFCRRLYIFSGLYYGITVPVQPMKVIGAYAIAMGLSASQVMASGALIGLFLLIIGGTGAVT